MAPNVNDKELRENGNPDSRGFEIVFEQKQAVDRLFTFNEGSKEATVNVIAEKTNEHYNTIAAILANLQLAMMKLENLKKLEINEDTK
ncbi:MAG TPA: hypothetical protein VHY08_17710, partial [Bacillota bacterium]|nr:hypothetical protein [Bacillota bacterium]